MEVLVQLEKIQNDHKKVLKKRAHRKLGKSEKYIIYIKLFFFKYQNIEILESLTHLKKKIFKKNPKSSKSFEIYPN